MVGPYRDPGADAKRSDSGAVPVHPPRRQDRGGGGRPCGTTAASPTLIGSVSMVRIRAHASASRRWACSRVSVVRADCAPLQQGGDLGGRGPGLELLGQSRAVRQRRAADPDELGEGGRDLSGGRQRASFRWAAGRPVAVQGSPPPVVDDDPVPDRHPAGPQPLTGGLDDRQALAPGLLVADEQDGLAPRP